MLSSCIIHMLCTMHQLATPGTMDGMASPSHDPDVSGIDPAVAGIQYELMLISRHHMRSSELRPHHRLEQSAYALLSRLELESPMSLRQLAEAFHLDLSTVNRQVSALLRKDLVEYVLDPDGGVARKVQPTALGLAQLRDDRVRSCEGIAHVMADWSDEDRAHLHAALTRFNQDIERLEETPWPRPR